MPALSNRIVKLENTLGVGPGAIIASRVDDMTDAQLETHLRAHGISPEPDDLVISLKGLAAGEEAPWISINGNRLTELEAEQFSSNE